MTVREKRGGGEDGEPWCGGFCSSCKSYHRLDHLQARAACIKLMSQLEQAGRIDFDSLNTGGDSRYNTDWLFGRARGKMFGVLLCRDRQGAEVELKAFSGQFNGLWQVSGWVDPLFDVAGFYQLTAATERQIKAFGKAMESLPQVSQQYLWLKQKRKTLSRELMVRIHGLYELHNTLGQRQKLLNIYGAKRQPPTGTGDCCAPKLLQAAARLQLQPVSMAEFYWGRENVSQSRSHGAFYPVCKSRCRPILGFQLCGIEEV